MVALKNITGIDDDGTMKKPVRRYKRFNVLVITFLLALFVLYQAIPRTIAAIAALPGNEVSLRIRDNQVVSIADLETLIASRQEAVKWVESGMYYTDLGLAQLMLVVLQADDRDLDDSKVREAIISLKKGLSLAPARPHAWTRLAYAESLVHGPSLKVAKALEMALVTAPFAPDLLFARLTLGLQAWPYLSPDTRELVYQQIRIAWVLSARSRKQLAILVRDQEGIDIVRMALSVVEDDLVAFDQMLETLPTR